MKTLSAIFLKGLAAVLPITVTIYLLYWLGNLAGSGLGSTVGKLFPRIPAEAHTWVGAALVVGVIFVIGLLMNAYVVRTVFRLGERLLQKIPLVKTLYGSVRDLMGFFSATDEKNKMSQVVMVTAGDLPFRLVGLVTRDEFGDLPKGIGGEDTVAVYLPMSYQLGGFTCMVSKSLIEPIDMSVEEAMRFAVTAGMSADEIGE